MLELQRLLIKYSYKGVRLLLGSFPFFITRNSSHGNYGRRLGASSIRDASSNSIIWDIYIVCMTLFDLL